MGTVPMMGRKSLPERIPLDSSVYPNRSPRDLNSTAVLAFLENQPAGTIVGEFNATDPDGDVITYHFVNGENNNSLFTLDTNGTLKTATVFDYESNASESYTIRVQAKDDQNATVEDNFIVSLIDYNEGKFQLLGMEPLPTLIRLQPLGIYAGYQLPPRSGMRSSASCRH